MKYIFFLLVVLLSFSNSMNAKDCFIVKDYKSGKIIEERGGELCKTRFSPCSSFKLPIALMGYDSGILKNENNPKFKYNSKISNNEYNNDWAMKMWGIGEKTPSDWMKNSIVWYSQIITYKLGLKKFQEYLKKFNYGNMNTSGKDAIRMGWLTASADKDGYIKISPEEQINFIENMLHKDFQIKSAAA